MARSVRADAVRNRERILEAARDQVALSGPDAQMADIARSAGVAVGTLYRHFPTKQDLVAAVVGEYVEQVRSDAQAALERVTRGAGALDEIVGFLGRVIDATARVQAVKAVAAEHDSSPADGEVEASRVVDQLLRRGREQGEIRPDLSVGDLYLLITSTPADITDEQRRRWLDLVVFGLASRTSRRSTHADAAGSDL